jgi:ketosteroid isomerase-like protein
MRQSIGSIAVVLTLLGALSACRTDKPEAQIRKAFEACRAAVEAGDAAAATAPLDPTFRGPEGLDRATARLYLMGLFRQEKIGVTVVRNEVSVRGDQALQEVDLLLTGRNGGLLPREASRRSFRLHWQKTEGDYRLLELEAMDQP